LRKLHRRKLTSLAVNLMTTLMLENRPTVRTLPYGSLSKFGRPTFWRLAVKLVKPSSTPPQPPRVRSI